VPKTDISDFKVIYAQTAPIGNTQAAMIARRIYDLAEKGEIMVEMSELEKGLMESMNHEQFRQGIQLAEKKELIIVSNRQLGMKANQTFASFRIKTISLDSVLWILKSLERDAMTPIEKAVQSRFKESFAVKMNTHEWNRLLDILRNPKLITKDIKKNEFEFDVIEAYDTISDSKTYSIYPKGHRWASFDMALKPSDVDQELFKEFVNFLEFYFLDESEKVPLEERYISGGRYGCAQFIKACGTPSLKECSLGQLSQFIQYAINKHILKHQRTLLVWNATPLKPKAHEVSSSDSEAVKKEKEKIKYKLKAVKQAICELLKGKPTGIPLAQLPQQLKHKLPFALDLNELGFLKLKELLVTMADQVKVDTRGHNYPIARLIQKKSMGEMYLKSYGLGSESFDKGQRHVPRYSEDMGYSTESFGKYYSFDFNRHLEMIRNCLYGLLQEYPLGIDCTKISLLIRLKSGIDFNVSFFGCSTLLEFLQKYVMGYYELEFILINPYDSSRFLIRLKGNTPMANYYNVQQYPTYPFHYRFETDPNALIGNTFTSPDYFSYAPTDNKSAYNSISEPTFHSSSKFYPSLLASSRFASAKSSEGISRALYAKGQGSVLSCHSVKTVEAASAETVPIQKKALSRSPSIDHDHYRSVSICNIPVLNEARSSESDEEYDFQQKKNIKMILDQTDEEISKDQLYLKPSVDPIHFKAYSEDFIKPLTTDVNSNELVADTSKIRSNLMPNNTSLFYPADKSMDETKIVTDLLNLQLESETSSVNNH